MLDAVVELEPQAASVTAIPAAATRRRARFMNICVSLVVSGARDSGPFGRAVAQFVVLGTSPIESIGGACGVPWLGPSR